MAALNQAAGNLPQQTAERASSYLERVVKVNVMMWLQRDADLTIE